MNGIRRTLALGIGFAAVVYSAQAFAEKIRVSYQTRETAVPLFIATERGFWKDVSLEPEISVFASGPPQIAAAGSWDVGITGGPPAALGAARFGLVSIAVATDESALNAMVARSADADAILKNPAELKGKQLLVTTNTTAEYAALACLKKWGLSKTDVEIVNLAPAQLISAFSSGSGSLAVTWTPFIYALEDKGGSKEICSGKAADATIISNFVARREFTKEQPELTAKALAVYLRAVAWMKKNPAEAVNYLKQYNEKNGVTLSQESLERTLGRSVTFTLQDEVKLFDRSAGAAQVDKWMESLSGYLVSAGTLTVVQDPKTYLDDSVLKMIDGNPKLKSFANGN